MFEKRSGVELDDAPAAVPAKVAELTAETFFACEVLSAETDFGAVRCTDFSDSVFPADDALAADDLPAAAVFAAPAVLPVATVLPPMLVLAVDEVFLPADGAARVVPEAFAGAAFAAVPVFAVPEDLVPAAVLFPEADLVVPVEVLVVVFFVPVFDVPFSLFEL